jgi:predicted RNA-binding Zn ribbon-like protein
VPIPRRRGRGRKKARALGSFISQEARQLDRLGHLMNERWKASVHAEVRSQVAAVIAATAALPYPRIPRSAAALFDALAAGQVFRFKVSRVPPDDAIVSQEHSTEQGLAALELGRFFRNPARSRLRRCEQCGTWFTDTTRNQSAKRCGRTCTIRWSNSQRGKRGET